MTALYIAGPMTGYPDFNYPRFAEVEGLLVAKGFRVLNPTSAEEENPTPGVPQKWEWYMRRALRMVLDADGLALIEGWEHSRGANMEHDLAVQLAMRVRPWDHWWGGLVK